MNNEKLNNAIAEAERFIKKAQAAQLSLFDNKLAYITGTKYTAAAKRASMDLTRSLAELRKPN